MSQTERIFKIEQMIAAQRVVSFGALLDELEVSRATLKRDLEFLRSRMHSPIIYDREAQGYRFDEGAGKDGRHEFPGLWFNASEVQALLTMRHLIANLQPGLLQRHIEPLLDRLKALLGSSGHDLEEIEKRVQILHMGRRAPKLKHFETAASALLNRRRLKMNYYARANDATTDRTVSPQRLVFYRESWYLDGWCHLRNGLRSFAVDSIRAAEILDEKAKEVAKKKLDEILASSYGIFSGRPKSWAVLRFTAGRARWIADEQWHPMQESRFLEDGNYELRVPYGDDRELAMDILRYGPDVQVMGPPALRRRIVAQLDAARRRYGE